MKKLFCVLVCLCLLFNGALTLAEEDDWEVEESFDDVEEESDEEEEESSSDDGDEEETSTDGDEDDEDESSDDDEEETESPEFEDDEEPVGEEESEEESFDEILAGDDEVETGDEFPESGIPDDAQAWFQLDGAPFGGSLSEVIDLLEGGETVYILTGRVIRVRDVPLDIIGDVSFRPDGDVFDDDCVVRLYDDHPDDGGALIDLSDGGYADVWFRVEDSEPEAPQQEDDIVLTVSPDDFEEGEWISRAPTFKLSGIPEDEDWMYAAIIYDDRIIPLSGDTYRPSDDGIYTIQFAIQDYLGDIIAVSDKLTPWFDWTKPKVTIEASKDRNYTLNITATDALSGVASLSLDSGKTWRTALDGATYTYSADSAATLPAGQIRVMDYAGNIYTSEKSYELAAVKTTTSTKSASGSSGSSSSSSTTSSGTDSHSSDTDEALDSEDALNLVISDEPMRQLVVDDQAMALTLTLETDDGARPISFTGSFEEWFTPDGRLSYVPNLLVLDASLEDVGDVFSCVWNVNGEVFRVLNNAGVDYVAFRALDDVCVVSAAGFIGGTKYTELKMQGVSTRQFDYALTMKVNRESGLLTALSDDDLSGDCDFALRVDVEDMAYELSASTRNPIYYYDICLGPRAMLSAPFGEYAG